MMTKRFDRSDPECRGLVASYRTIGERLSEEAVAMRSFLHERYYPDFGRIGGIKRRAIVRRFRLWDDIFRDHAERLFRLCYEVEEKLVFSIAIDGRTEHRELFSVIRQRRLSIDRLLRAVHARMRRFRDAESTDTEALYAFCSQVERAALFAHFVSLVLYQSNNRPENVRDPRFIDIDWSEVERYSDGFPEEVQAEIVTPEAVTPHDRYDRSHRASTEPPPVDDEPIIVEATAVRKQRERPPRGERSSLLRRLR